MQINSWELPKPNDFNAEEIFWFLDRGYDDCLHEANKNGVIKLVEIDGQFHLVQIKNSIKNLNISVLNKDIKNSTKLKINAFLNDWFDLDRSLQAFYSLIQQNDALYQRISPYKGLRLIGIPNLFEALSWAIIGQQINLTFAYRLKRNLVECYGTQFDYLGKSYYHFPEPKRIAHCTVDDLKGMKFSTRKAEYIIGVAQLFENGSLSKANLLTLGSTSKIITELCKIRGIGEWTANYVLMKCLKRMNCIPYGDSGLTKAIQLVDNRATRPNRMEQERFFDQLSGWESYTTFYLWQSLSK